MKYLRPLILSLLISSVLASSAFAFRSSIGFWRPAQFADYISTLFNQGNSSGTVWDSTNGYVRLDQSATPPDNSLNTSWTPEWASLAGYWKLDDAVGSGTVVDSSGNGLTGSVNVGVTLGVPGKLGTAGSFNGGSYSNINFSAVSLPSQFSVQAWINVNPGASNIQAILTNSGTGTASGFRFYVDTWSTTDQALVFEVGDGGTNTTLSSPAGSVSFGSWHYVVLTADQAGGVVNLYVDGSLVANTTSLSITNYALNQNISIGSFNNGSLPLWGSIDDVAIWNKELTGAEVSTIYARQSPYYYGSTNNGELDSTWAPAWSNIVGLWHLDDGAGSTSVADSSGNGISGTVVPGTTLEVTGKLNTAATYNGSSGYINYGNPGPANFGTSDFTAMAWVNVVSLPSNVTYFLTKRAVCNYDNFWGIGLTSTGNLNIEIDGGGSGNYYSENSNQIISTGVWHNLIVTRFGTVVTVYIDGSMDSSFSTGGSAPNVSNSGNLLAGSSICVPSSGGNYLNGSMDEIALWNTALNAAQVQSIYSRQSAKYAGTFTSRVMDGLAAATNWTSLSLSPTLPFFKELPDGGSSESPSNYISQSSGLMNGNVALFHLDEVAGTSGANSVLDKSGNGNNGTPSGGVTFGTAGKLGTAATFDGSSGYIGGIGLAPAGTSDWTESAWIRTTSTNAGVILTNRGYSANASLTLDVGNWGNALQSNGIVYFSLDNSGCEYGVPSSVNVADGNWHHVVGIRGSYNFSIYVDGVLQTPAPMSIGGSCQFDSAASTDPWQIGWGPQWTNSNFNGSIDEVGIWNRALSSSEILELYRRGVNRIKYQVRSCPDATCSTSPTWLGPDGTNQTYFSELNNNAVQSDGQDFSGSDSVLAGLPSLKFANFGSLSVPANRYFQYRALMESDDLGTGCNYGSGPTWCSPELQSVNVGP